MLTDHKLLTYAPSSRSDKYSPRQAQHLDFISQFTTDIRHVKRDRNLAADALSRAELNTVKGDQSSEIDFKEFAAAQREDPELLEL